MSGREKLIHQLRNHRPASALEETMRAQILAFVEAHEDCFERTNQAGHITGSAWVVNPGRTRALLVHHARLNKWLQPGGHCDGDSNVLGVAMREAWEETGATVRPVHEEIFDVDAHEIPARKNEPAHIHYDVRFFLEAGDTQPIAVSEESHAVELVDLEAIAARNTDQSVLRLVEKTRAL